MSLNVNSFIIHTKTINWCMSIYVVVRMVRILARRLNPSAIKKEDVN